MTKPIVSRSPDGKTVCTRCGNGGQFPPEHASWCAHHPIAEATALAIVAYLRNEADKRDDEAADVIAKHPDAFAASDPPNREAERAWADYHRLSDAGNELRAKSDEIELGRWRASR